MAKPSSQCHLLERLLELDRALNYSDLIEIENIVSGGSNCLHAHPSLTELAIKRKHHFRKPLLHLACEKGDLEMVKRLVEVWGADVKASIDCQHKSKLVTNSYSNCMFKVGPLFVASLNHHSKIVRYLIQNGADVCSFSKDGLTALHAAFFSEGADDLDSSEQIDTIRCLVEAGADPSALSSKEGIPIWMMGSIDFYHGNLTSPSCFLCRCSPRATILLIELGMSVTQRDPVGRTILHHLAGPSLMNDTKVIELLLEKGADLHARDNEGITPIMAAAIGNNKLPNVPILKYLSEREDIPNIDKINALEVAAAIILGYEEKCAHLNAYDYDYYPSLKDEYVNHVQDIFFFLDRARYLRQQDNCLLIPNKSVNGRTVEFITSVKNFHDIELNGLYEYGIQSILIRFRIFSSISWRAVYRYLWNITTSYYYSKKLKENRQFSMLLDISWKVLETVRCFDLQEKHIYSVTVLAVQQIVETLQELHRRKDSLFNMETVKTSLNLMLATYQVDHPDINDETGWNWHHFESLYDLISMLNRLPEMMSNNEITNPLRLIISQNGLGEDKCSLIQKAIYEEPPQTLFAMVDLLLQSGADPHIFDCQGNGVLHFLAEKDASEQREATGRLLRDHGIHLDRANYEGETAADIWRKKMEEEEWEEDEAPVLPDWLKEDVAELKCLAARVVRRKNIPYDSTEILPETLIDFVNWHGSH